MSTNDDTDVDTEAQPAYEEDELQTTRRNAAKFFAALGGAAAVGTFAVSGLKGLNDAALSGGPDYNYKTLYAQGTKLVDKEGNGIKVGDIPKGSGNEKTVFPEKKGGGALQVKTATTLLARFSESDFKSPTNTDGTVDGYVAYSGVCTHAGCIVSQRAGPDNEYFHCPCHQSTYNPLEGCKVVGGPAPRALPQLPIGVTEDDNQLIIATGPFEGPIGPQ
ncbi:ubiquinol-cytochrome C reductase iron-sulfur subunit [Halarchaeum acidiphilum MH1-52-1]|uniref:Ubiquinol-cytochrome C reductase iron-sulfur subunit n=1 Tax=Halarchaeum acidiphilum MH1-52-1 TaxID=1261545 RepID=U2YWT7_9EURY|nr:ubiquinol-cytochrome c reductase iron-sulfur subunit [Halarchaeum acidiphilum]GAD53505.1 ubiquinol-cytochrome C reductase iron-sulfur subunit [Halarchaeum acidiphilum MH1-52-1]